MPLHEEIKRRQGNKDAIISGLLSGSTVFKAQAICGAVNNKVFDKAIQKNLERLIDDGEIIMGYSISQFAIAALDKLGGVKYTGEDPIIKKLLQANKWFEYDKQDEE